MTPTNELRFVRRTMDPDTTRSTLRLILQQKWAETDVMMAFRKGATYEWRDVPVADAS